MTNSSRTFEGQEIIRASIRKIVTKEGMKSLRTIAAKVKEETKMDVSPSTVGRLLRKMKLYDRPSVKWEKVKS